MTEDPMAWFVGIVAVLALLECCFGDWPDKLIDDEEQS